jgi:flagellar biosynthetic protein FliR
MIISIPQIEVFFFILARILGVFSQAPIFNSRSVSSVAKMALAVWLTFCLLMVTPVNPHLPSTLFTFILTLVAEVAVGFTIGFICNTIFIAIQSAGELIDTQMGLSVASSLDPIFGAVISIIGKLTFYISLIIFLLLDGHHMVLAAFHQSFTVLPAGTIGNFANYNLAAQIMNLGTMLWLTAIKLAAPMLLLIFLADFTFGIVSRVAPQVNVFQLGFQVKPLLGLFGILVTLPYTIKYIGSLLGTISEQLVQLLMILKP